MQVLVDADNVHPRRLRALVDAVATAAPEDVRWVAVGRTGALSRTQWPDGTELFERQGWQSADLALAEAYRPDDLPLVVASGDGDFALLVQQHPGPVLVVAAQRSTSARMRDGAAVIDPVLDGEAPLVEWLRGATATDLGTA